MYYSLRFEWYFFKKVKCGIFFLSSSSATDSAVVVPLLLLSSAFTIRMKNIRCNSMPLIQNEYYNDS